MLKPDPISAAPIRSNPSAHAGFGFLRQASCFAYVACAPVFLSGCAVDTRSDLNLANLLFLVFSLLAVVFAIAWAHSLWRRRQTGQAWSWPNLTEIAIGAVTDFFDTLGIGSFAPTTVLLRLSKRVPDELLPGTLNVGHTLATVAQALIFIRLVDVEASTLLPMILSAGVGAWLGSGLAKRLPRFQIRVVMGFALLLAALIMLASMLGWLPKGHDALGLKGWYWGAGVIGNFVLGVLMPLGIGLYAPCMILVSLLGMSPLAAFPIMMGSCAFLMPLSSMRFCRNGQYQVSAALGICLGGIPAVFLAAFLVKELPLASLRWLVLSVVLLVAVNMLTAAWREKRSEKSQSSPEPANL